MRRYRWPLLGLLVLLAGVPLTLYALGVRLPWNDPQRLPEPRPVPAGDQEVAWLQTATSWESWEQFVLGLKRAAAEVPGLAVDDSNAFPEQTTATPEVVLTRQPYPG